MRTIVYIDGFNLYYAMIPPATLTQFTGSLSPGQILDRVRIDDLDLDAADLSRIEATCCVFRRCRFSRVRLNEGYFTDCAFDECDLSNAGVDGARFDLVRFRNSKLIGINWGMASELLFRARFDGCNLSYGEFRQMALRGIEVIDCNATECDFTGASLRDAVFRGTDLQGAQFLRTDLRNADFRDARNVVVDVRENEVKGLRVSIDAAVTIAQLFGVRVDD